MTTVNTERQYLNSRIYDAKYTKLNAMQKDFRLNNSDAPATYKELIDAIKNDKYELDTKKTNKIDVLVADEDYFGGYGPFFGIKFKLPTAPDYDGYNIAEKAMAEELKKAKDIINTADAAAGLKALQDFEAWSPMGNAS